MNQIIVTFGLTSDPHNLLFTMINNVIFWCTVLYSIWTLQKVLLMFSFTTIQRIGIFGNLGILSDDRPSINHGTNRLGPFVYDSWRYCTFMFFEIHILWPTWGRQYVGFHSSLSLLLLYFDIFFLQLCFYVWVLLSPGCVTSLNSFRISFFREGFGI